ALGACVPVILALRAVADLDRLDEVSSFARPRRESLAARLDSVVETEKGSRIDGTAATGTAVFLFAGGKLVASLPAGLGHFRFEGVRERGPFRVGAMLLSPELPEAAPAAVSRPIAPSPASSGAGFVTRSEPRSSPPLRPAPPPPRSIAAAPPEQPRLAP